MVSVSFAVILHFSAAKDATVQSGPSRAPGHNPAIMSVRCYRRERPREIGKFPT